MKIDFALALLLALATVINGSRLDFTCINTNPNFGPGGDVNLVAVGPNKQHVEIRRYMTTTVSQHCDLIPAAVEETKSSHITFRSLTGDDVVRTGVFSCKTTTEGDPITIPVFSHLKGSLIRPLDQVTVAIGRAGNSTISVVGKGAGKITWTRSGRGSVIQRNNPHFNIKKTTRYFDGIYEAYRRKTRAHAVMRLIVRNCPDNLFGEKCKDVCPCYNGGACTDDGECICPPGFTGSVCEVVETSNCFGRDCQYNCSDVAFNTLQFSATCEGHLFCLPDPYGCSCYPGYKGLGCDIACSGGTFGADCKQTCHCAAGSQCEGRKGICSPARCQIGWTGVNCNEPVKRMKQ